MDKAACSAVLVAGTARVDRVGGCVSAADDSVVRCDYSANMLLLSVFPPSDARTHQNGSRPQAETTRELMVPGAELDKTVKTILKLNSARAIQRFKCCKHVAYRVES